MFARSIVILLLAAPLVGLAAHSVAAACSPYTYSSTQFDRYHMYGTAKEFWEESNGVAGLQRTLTVCSGASVIPRDTCITHSENNALVACLATYPTH